MLLTFEEKDAIGEIANISVGAAACYIGNIIEEDVDVSVPNIFEINSTDGEVNLRGMSVGYEMTSTAFTAGYCAFILPSKFDEFKRMLGCTYDENNEKLLKILARVMESAVEPIERLMQHPIKVSVSKELSYNEPLKHDKSVRDMVCINFDFRIERFISGKVLFLYPEKIAKEIAAKFINEGIAITMV